MGILLLEEDDVIAPPDPGVDRPRVRITPRFFGGRSDHKGLILHVGDAFIMLEAQLLGLADAPIDLTDRVIFLRWRLNTRTTEIKDTSITDLAQALVTYPVQAIDLPTAGQVTLEAVISDPESGYLTSDPMLVTVEDTL
jgi:hypothetical protein